MRTPTTLTKEELSPIKHTLFGMLQSADKWDDPDYESLCDSLKDLSFKRYSLDSYAVQLGDIVEEMIDLDDIGFDMGQLYHFKGKLK